MAGSFTMDITKFVAKSKLRVDIVVRKITLDVFSSVIKMSPVDKGVFRGNWVASFGGYSTATVNTPDLSGVGTLREVTNVVVKSKAGGVVYLVNNLPYAQRLEYGYSKRAPAGMVGVTIANYQNYVKGAIN